MARRLGVGFANKLEDARMPMKTWYAKIKSGSGSVPVKTEATTSSNAKKYIQAQYGKNVKFINNPVSPSNNKPPGWFR